MFDSNISKNTKLIKDEATRLGFMDCGISKAEFLENEAPRLDAWLNKNYHGEMGYMANHFDKRLNPTLLVEGAKTVVSLSYNYFTSQEQMHTDAPKISKYAYGKDYHDIIKQKLFRFLDFIKENIGEVDGRAFVDSAPVLDKAWAAKSGLGWVGKHSNIISKENGSFFFIAELIIDLELEPDIAYQKDYCGTCTKCIDACPTQAIYEPFKVNGTKCISYLTIELKDAIPDRFKGQFNNWAFGCDICQDVCPWNRFSSQHSEEEFNASSELLEMSSKDWQEITEETFRRVFKKSAVKRTKFNGLKRNLNFIKTT